MKSTGIALIVCLSALRSWAGDEYEYEFVEAATMPAATAAHSAVGLADGNVLVVGGLGKLFGLPIAVNLGRVYEVEDDRWRVLESRMQYGRIGAGVTRLLDGKVMIAGGLSQSLKAMTLVEVYDPETEQFSVVGQMQKPRKRPRLNVLLDGRVRISGQSRYCELLEPGEGGYRLRMVETPTYSYHMDHVAVTLRDGSVVLIGGRDKGIERFDPESETYEHCSTRLPEVLDDVASGRLYDERVLMVGGQRVFTMVSTETLWLYDPKMDQLQEGPALGPSSNGKILGGAADVVAVDLHGSDPKKRGRFFLLCGGEYDPGKKNQGKDVVLNYAKVYDAERNRLIDVGPMRHERDEFAGVSLPDKEGQARVLLIGGYRSGDQIQGSCEIFHWREKID